MENTIKDLIIELMAEHSTDEDLPGITSIEDFKEVGMLTNNEGLVFKFADGSEYQMAIVKSK